ncbi:uncharacterized protein LOC135219451 [Macrobrachium nipponense]|uniref:uncharacterized protein LOC135219451 n=1 Tax=Macrobrachium nipponense TaxID=159736 RepID=UPI0030C7EF2A
MKTLWLPWLTVAIVVVGGAVAAKNQELAAGGDPGNLIVGMVMGMIDYVKETKTCINPNPLAAEMFGMICDTPGCDTNGKHCMEAIMPFDFLCEYSKKCILGDDGIQKFNPRVNPIAMIGRCVTKNVVRDMNMEYVEGDNQENIFSLFEKIMASTTNHIPESTKQELLSAVLNDVCLAPGDDYNVRDVMRFQSCLMKKCVKSLATN